MSHPLLADLERDINGFPLFAERVAVLFSVVPFCTTKNERDSGEKESTRCARATDGERATHKSRMASPDFNAVMQSIRFFTIG